MAAAALAARRIHAKALAASAVAARRIQTTAPGASAAAGGHTRSCQDLLRRLPQAEGRVASGKLQHRILKLEVLCSFYNNLGWVLFGPIVGTLMTIPLAINISHDISRLKEEQKKNRAEQLSNLRRRIEYLEGMINQG